MNPNISSKFKEQIPTGETSLRYAVLLFSLPLFLFFSFVYPFILKLIIADYGNLGFPIFLRWWIFFSHFIIFSGFLIIFFLSLFQQTFSFRNLNLMPLEKNVNSHLERSEPRFKLYKIKSDEPNAFVISKFFRTPKIVLTTSLLENLSYNEIQAVIEHEKGHLQNKDTFYVLWGITFTKNLKYWFLGSLSLELISIMLSVFYSVNNMNSIIGFLWWILIIYGVCQLTIRSTSRVREELADAHVLTTSHSYALISAMRKTSYSISNLKEDSYELNNLPHQIKFVQNVKPLNIHRWIKKNIFLDHPDVKERIVNLQNKKYLITEGKFYPLSIGSSLYIGILSSLLMFTLVKVMTSIFPGWDMNGISLFSPVFIVLFSTWFMAAFSYIPSMSFRILTKIFLTFIPYQTLSYFIVFIFNLSLWLHSIITGVNTASDLVNLTFLSFQMFILHNLASLACFFPVLIITKILYGYLQRKYPNDFPFWAILNRSK